MSPRMTRGVPPTSAPGWSFEAKITREGTTTRWVRGDHVADVSFFDRVLTTDEIQTIYNQGSSAERPSFEPMSDVEYFQRNLFRALKIPREYLSRLEESSF